MVGLGLLALLLGRRWRAVRTTPNRGDGFGDALERGLFGAALVGLLVVGADRMLLSTTQAVAGTDEAHIWASKAKVIFETGGFGDEFRAEMATGNIVSHRDYPLLNPLLQVWVFAQAGRIVHVENRLPILLFAPALLCITAASLRRRLRPGAAALVLVCVGSLGFFVFSTNRAFSDILIAFGLVALWDAWSRYEEEPMTTWGGMISITCAFLLWSKNEGRLLVLVFALAVLIAHGTRRAPPDPTRKSRIAALALVLVAPALAWGFLAGFNRHFELPNDLLEGFEAEGVVAGREAGTGFLTIVLEKSPERIGPVLRHFAEHIVTKPDQTRLLLLLFLVLLVLFPRLALSGRLLAPTLGLALSLGGYLLVFLGTYRDVDRHLATSAHRLVFQLTPLAGIWIGAWLGEALPSWKPGGADPRE